MTDITYRSDMSVTLIQASASDDMVAKAARVSTVGAESVYADGELKGLINFLMKNRHGSPFEHGQFTFLVECPIFVAREVFRHRMSSFNEESGRYKEMDPVFYVIPDDRPLVQVGKPGAYTFERGTDFQVHTVQAQQRGLAALAYASYKGQLEKGIAREVARDVLPLSLYTSFYMTMNPRALMNFLSLRTYEDYASYPSFPLFEIEQVARKMESHFRYLMPLTYKAFNENGRVQP